MKLHIFPASPNARKAMIANRLMGLELPEIIVDLPNGAQRQEAFLAMNPNGKVPVLEFADGSTLWESNAIINRMATAADSDLWPKSMARYDIMRWQFWEACHWTPACGPFIGAHLFQREGVDLDAAARTFHQFAAVLDGHLAGRSWLVGEQLTTADIAVSPILYLRETCQFPLAGYANIAAWIGRMEALSAWQSVNASQEAA